MTGTSFNKLKEVKEDKKLRNDIKEIKNVRSLKFVNLNLDSPNMKEAMKSLGMQADDIQTNKTMDDFSPSKSQPVMD